MRNLGDTHRNPNSDQQEFGLRCVSPKFPFSDRTRWKFAPNKLSRLLEALRRKGIAYLDLTQSNPTDCGIKYLPGLLATLANPKNGLYRPDPLGSKRAREALAKDCAQQGIPVDPGGMVLTASTSEAYSFVLRLLAGPEERVLFP